MHVLEELDIVIVQLEQDNHFAEASHLNEVFFRIATAKDMKSKKFEPVCTHKYLSRLGRKDYMCSDCGKKIKP